MKKNIIIFIIVGLALAFALAFFISPHASKSPDGLDKFSHDQKFEVKAEGKEAWTHAPMADYNIGSVKNKNLSTGIAGVAGVILAFGLGIGLAWLLKRRIKSSPESTVTAKQ